MRNWLFGTIVGLCFVLSACGDDAGATDQSSTGSQGTAATTTSGSGGQGGQGGANAQGGAGGQSSSSTQTSGSGGQAQVPLAGFGDIEGTCGVLEPMDLNSTAPTIHSNSIDFKSLMFMASMLSTGGQKVHDDGNLGGSSLMSEIFAYEVLYRCELAELLKTESEINYQDAGGKKTDLLVRIDGLPIGVSVTRAVGFPKEDPYTVAQAKDLLSSKLQGVAASSANVASGNAWKKQVLFVVAYAQQHADALKEAFNQIEANIKGDTIVWITVTDGDDAFIY